MLPITDITASLPRNPGDKNWRTRPLAAIRRIVIHYDAVYVPPPAPSTPGIGYDALSRYIEQARYHINKNWNENGGPIVRGFGLMYHYRVSADGCIWQTQPEELVTWHARAANYSGLAICCDLGPGQFPLCEQLNGLKALLDQLCHHRPDIPAGKADVWGHGELTADGNHTDCPGALLAWVRTYREA